MRYNAPLMQVSMDKYNTCPPWCFPRWSANKSPWKSSNIAQAPNRPGTYATTSTSTCTTCCLQTANNFCISSIPSNTISLHIQLSHNLTASGNTPNVEPFNHPWGVAAGYWASSRYTWPLLLPLSSAVIDASPAARNVDTPLPCPSLCLLTRACSPCPHLLIVHDTPPIHHTYMSCLAQTVIHNMSRDVTHPPRS